MEYYLSLTNVQGTIEAYDPEALEQLNKNLQEGKYQGFEDLKV